MKTVDDLSNLIRFIYDFFLNLPPAISECLKDNPELEALCSAYDCKNVDL